MNATLEIAPEAVEELSQELQTVRILVVDDQAEIADVLAEMIKLLGYEAVPESEPQKALERLDGERFDLILSDYRMPEMTGEEFYNAAIAAYPKLQGRFIFLTGDLLADPTRAFLESTGAPYLRKPFNLAKARTVISERLAALE